MSRDGEAESSPLEPAPCSISSGASLSFSPLDPPEPAPCSTSSDAGDGGGGDPGGGDAERGRRRV